ncbi:MAG: hypothetical protein H0X12_04990 [Nocardioides sp.]|nr:hypothetical protein [Nocardioides sp.]
MSKVEVFRRWPDGDVLSVTIKVDESYPDALDQAKRTALDAYAEALGVTLADVPEET